MDPAMADVPDAGYATVKNSIILLQISENNF